VFRASPGEALEVSKVARIHSQRESFAHEKALGSLARKELIALAIHNRAVAASKIPSPSRTALSWIPAGGGQEPPLNNTLIQVEPE